MTAAAVVVISIDFYNIFLSALQPFFT